MNYEYLYNSCFFNFMFYDDFYTIYDYVHIPIILPTYIVANDVTNYNIVFFNDSFPLDLSNFVSNKNNLAQERGIRIYYDDVTSANLFLFKTKDVLTQDQWEALFLNINCDENASIVPLFPNFILIMKNKKYFSAIPNNSYLVVKIYKKYGYLFNMFVPLKFDFVLGSPESEIFIKGIDKVFYYGNIFSKGLFYYDHDIVIVNDYDDTSLTISNIDLLPLDSSSSINFSKTYNRAYDEITIEDISPPFILSRKVDELGKNFDNNLPPELPAKCKILTNYDFTNIEIYDITSIDIIYDIVTKFPNDFRKKTIIYEVSKNLNNGESFDFNKLFRTNITENLISKIFRFIDYTFILEKTDNININQCEIYGNRYQMNLYNYNFYVEKSLLYPFSEINSFYLNGISLSQDQSIYCKLILNTIDYHNYRFDTYPEQSPSGVFNFDSPFVVYSGKLILMDITTIDTTDAMFYVQDNLLNILEYLYNKFKSANIEIKSGDMINSTIVKLDTNYKWFYMPSYTFEELYKYYPQNILANITVLEPENNYMLATMCANISELCSIDEFVIDETIDLTTSNKTYTIQYDMTRNPTSVSFFPQAYYLLDQTYTINTINCTFNKITFYRGLYYTIYNEYTYPSYYIFLANGNVTNTNSNKCRIVVRVTTGSNTGRVSIYFKMKYFKYGDYQYFTLTSRTIS